MALSEVYSGSNATWGTEYSFTSAGTSLGAMTSEAAYTVWLDLNALTSGDNYMLRMYEKVRSASTQRKVIEHAFSGVQTPANWVFPTVHLKHGWDVTLQRTSGSDRTIEFSIRRIV